MKLYQCKVRLAGDLRNEVPKSDVTPAEIMLLQLLHGGADAVVAIQETGDAKRTHEEERARLRFVYQDAIAKTERGQMDPIMQLFGPEHLPLPTAFRAPTPEVAPASEIASLLA